MPAVLVGLGAIAYSNGLGGAFIFDDVSSIPNNPHLLKLWPLTKTLSGPPETTVAGRPVVAFTLALNYSIGGLDVVGYHAFNIVVHILSTLLLFELIRRTVAAPVFERRYEHSASWLALICAGLWIAHPLQTEAVTYIIQRTELLAGFFIFLMYYCAIRGWSGRHRTAWLSASVISCGLAMGSKEVAVGAPILLLLYDVVFRSGSLARAIGRNRLLYTGLALTWLIPAYFLLTGARSGTVGLHLRVFPFDYLLTQADVITYYVRLCFWPSPLIICYEDWPIAQHFREVGPEALLVLSLLAATIWAIARGKPIGFLGAWFFLILAPTSSVIPIVSEIAAERRMYLPLAAVVMVVVFGAFRVMNQYAPGLRLGALTAGILIVIFCSLTIARNRDYQSAVAIWSDTVTKRPGMAFGHFQLGNALAAESRLPEAIEQYEKTMQLKPGYSEAYGNYANVLASQGRLDDAVSYYEKALSLRPDLPEVHNNFGTLLVNQGKFDEAVPHFKAALQKMPRWLPALNNLGFALTRLGRFEEATKYLRVAVESDPNSIGPRRNLAGALTAIGRFDEAIHQYRECLRLDPNDAVTIDRLKKALEKRAAASGR